MAYMRVRSLFVLTLLQLCRAEISDSLQESWYSANVISDGFQPKPISEIFSTESPFSSTNPIVVLPKQSSSVPDEILLLSTLAPPRKISTTGSSVGDFSKISVAVLQSSTPLPPTIQTIPPSSLHTLLPTTFQTTPPTFLSTPSTIPDYSPSSAPQQPQIITKYTEQTHPPSLPEFSIKTDLSQTTLSVPQPNFGLQSTLAQPQSPSSQSSQTQSQQIRLELVPRRELIPGQNLPEKESTQIQQSQSSTLGPHSNYFLIYQQAPQSIQGFPGPVGTEVPQLSTIVQVPTTREPSRVIIQPAPTVSPPSTRTAPPTSTTPLPTAVRVQTTPTARTTRPCQNLTNFAPTPIPQLPPLGGSLRIRVVAPSGSITNVNFNPTARTTTTRRPTTTRTRKTPRPRRNNYETCTDGCKGRREPICAAPLSTAFLNPDTLKGFPSVCHMACHNSYRKDPYEKVLDGRCGRLRTRIRTVDSNTKLKREELNKAQYFLDNSGTKTIVEFSAYEKVLDGRCGRLRTRIRTVDSNTKLKREELNKAQYFLDNSGTKTIVEFSGLNK